MLYIQQYDKRVKKYCFQLKYPMSPDKKMFTTRLNKELLRKLKILAVNEEKPASELIEEALVDLLKKYDKKK